ncbi:MAG: carboxymuconolactone decarboxylase family protein [Petrimonas sp.]|nr:carboxymuconolactone decarboxylase family protein [Petrimonas sp.]
MRTGRNLYTLGEAYTALYNGFRSVRHFSKARKSGLVTEQFQERLMLAVTEVNNCPMCTYGHTKMALQAGLSADEIRAILLGQMEATPADELPGVMFAQHYAEERGKPSKEAWKSIISRYGEPKAKGVLGAIRMITIGNTYGIPLGSFLNRFRPNAKPDTRSSLGYETGLYLITILYIPMALIHTVIARLFRLPLL